MNTEGRFRINLSRFDLVSMRLLLECMRCGSISAAAVHCHLSVMGASARLQRLEETLGKALFHRNRGGLEVTAAGVVAVRWAETILLSVQSMLDDVGATEASAPTLVPNPGRRGKASAQHPGKSPFIHAGQRTCSVASGDASGQKVHEAVA